MAVVGDCCKFGPRTMWCPGAKILWKRTTSDSRSCRCLEREIGPAVDREHPAIRVYQGGGLSALSTGKRRSEASPETSGTRGTSPSGR